MGDRLLQLLDFFLERPPLTGALVCGALYLLKRSRKPHLSATERQHAVDLSEAQRTYAEKMYDPPTDEEQAAAPQPRNGSAGRRDEGRHGACATRQTRVGAVRVDLIARELGLRALARDDHRAPAAVHLFGMPEGFLQREDEEHLQHLDNVVVAVIVIVEQDDVVQGKERFPFGDSGLRSNRGFRHGPLRISMPCRDARGKSVRRRRAANRAGYAPGRGRPARARSASGNRNRIPGGAAYLRAGPAACSSGPNR